MSFSPSLQPHIKSADINGNTATIELSVPPVRWFDGHFEGEPVLPGIALILWAKAAFMQHYSVHIAADMPKVKFTRIVSPGAELTLMLTVSKQLKFSYQAPDGSTICEGQFLASPKATVERDGTGVAD